MTEVLEQPVEVVEELTDTAIEIAQIEADTSIAIAETQAAVEIARIEAFSEDNRELAECRERLTLTEVENNLLRVQISTLEQDLEATRALLETPSEVLISETDPPTLEVENLSSIPSDTLASIDETQTGPIVVKDNAEEVVVAVPLVSARKPIFKLV